MRALIISTVLAVGAMAVSCNRSGLETPPVPPRPNGTPVGVSLTTAPLETPAAVPTGKANASHSKGTAGEAMTVAFGGAETKVASLTSEQEHKIHDLWVIQFDKASGALVGQPYYATSEQIRTNPSTGKLEFEAKLTTASTAQIVCFVANTNSPSTFNAANCGTMADMENVCRRIGAEYKPTADGGLPMLTVKEYPQIAAGTPLTGAVLRRLVAKVVLRCRVSSGFAGFTLTGVRLRNVPAAIWYATEKNGVDFPDKVTTYGSESHIDYPAEDLTQALPDGEYMAFTWYVPENLRKAVTTVAAERDRTPDKTDGMATYIEIEGDFKSPFRCERLIYRLMLGDVQNDVNDYNVRRNYVYTATVTLEGRNAGDNRLTVESFDMNNSAMVVPNSGNKGAVTFDIRKLTRGWQTTMPALGDDADLRAELLWTDNAALASQLNIGLDKVNGLLTVKSTGAAEGNAVVALYNSKTDGSGEILWSWHAWVTKYHPDGGREYGLPANSKAVVTGGQVHTYGTTYLATNPGKVIMDRNLGATKAYYKAPSAGDLTADQAFGLLYQWGRKDPFPRPQGSSVDETSAAGILIPIYGATGDKLDPEGDKNVTTGSGCKKVSIATAGSNAPATLNYTIKNPLNSIYNEQGAPYDWYTTSASNQNNDLWGNGTTKSIYDPCPEGWRVPTIGTWSDFTREAADPMAGTFPYYVNGVISETGSKFYAANGRLYKVSTSGTGTPLAWYPAAGYRERATGTLGGIGRFGYSWASSARDSDGAGLSFGPSGLSHAFATGLGARAYSYQVRCIQE